MKMGFDNFNDIIISFKELKLLNTRMMQIDAMANTSNPKVPIMTNENEFLMNKYSFGKTANIGYEFPDESYLPSQDEMIQLYDTLKSKRKHNPWKTIVEILLRINDDKFADEKHVIALKEIYVPCSNSGWVVISEEE